MAKAKAKIAKAAEKPKAKPRKAARAVKLAKAVKVAKRTVIRKTLKTRSPKPLSKKPRPTLMFARPKPVYSYWSFGMVVALTLTSVYLLVTGKMPETDRSAARSSSFQESINHYTATDSAEVGSTLLSEEFSSARSLPLSERMGFWSQYLWKTPSAIEKISGLVSAEFKQKIQDDAPMVPVRFDCTTFVETVSALARSQTSADFAPNLVAIRYRDARPEFLYRNHFPEADWIPNNARAGILSDVTEEIAKVSGFVAQTQTKEIQRAKWLVLQLAHKKVSRSIASTLHEGMTGKVAEEWKTPVQVVVPYLALNQLDKAMEHIPDGAIINLVRQSDAGHPVLISHQGLVFHQNGILVFRHASVAGNVRTVPLKDYLDRYVKNHEESGWPLVGINVNQVRAPGVGE